MGSVLHRDEILPKMVKGEAAMRAGWCSSTVVVFPRKLANWRKWKILRAYTAGGPIAYQVKYCERFALQRGPAYEMSTSGMHPFITKLQPDLSKDFLLDCLWKREEVVAACHCYVISWQENLILYLEHMVVVRIFSYYIAINTPFLFLIAPLLTKSNVFPCQPTTWTLSTCLCFYS